MRGQHHLVALFYNCTQELRKVQRRGEGSVA